jgi:dolichol kinase
MAWQKQSCAGSAPAPPVSTVAALSAWWHGQSEVSQPWAVEQPNNRSLLNVILLLSLASLVGTLAFNGLRNKERFLEAWGVNARKVHRTIKEVDRKMFHLATLLVPLIHQLLLNVGWTNEDCVSLCWAITITGWTADISRVYGPGWIQRNWPMQRILREKEKNQLTGSCYLSLGCTLTMAISPPSITMASILFLILGDLSAAIVGVSFGGETVSLKLGRAGKKSAEGSMAMLLVCFCIGCVTFWNVELREYPVRAPPLRRLAPLHRPLEPPCAALRRLVPPCVALRFSPHAHARRTRSQVAIGAIVATLTELIEPFGINDNLTIPIFSSIALQYGFSRISTCNIAAGSAVTLAKGILAKIDVPHPFDWYSRLSDLF